MHSFRGTGCYPSLLLRQSDLAREWACRHPEAGVNTAPCPERILPKSKLSDATIVDVLVKKYGDYLPAYRQSMILERDAQIDLSRKTLVSVILKAGELLKALIPGLRGSLQRQIYPGRRNPGRLPKSGRT